MRFHVYFGVLLFAAITSAEFHPIMKEVNIKFPFDRKLFNSKIKNGLPAVDGQFPFVARIFMHNARCGGALISPSWVLTTATCFVYQGANATVYLGSVDQARPVLMILTNDTRRYPNFISAGNQNNIGLVNLRHSVMFSETIAPITLPRKSQAYLNFGSGRLATVAGWGIVNQDDVGTSGHVHFGTVLIISNDQCKLIIGPSLSNTTVCTVPIGDGCGVRSDHAASMYFRDLMDDVDILVGMTEIGSCFSAEFPTHSIRPQYYLDWIYNTTGLPIRP